MTDLTALRAEVERLRKAAQERSDEPRLHYIVAAVANAKADAYAHVLDLIDKHTREGQ